MMMMPKKINDHFIFASKERKLKIKPNYRKKENNINKHK